MINQLPPRWLVDKRHQTCLECLDNRTCNAQYRMLTPDPRCPLGKLPTLSDAIAARAWPESAPPVTDCCGSALQYS